ncbi:MAG: GAF domain-containing protein [Erysipelotrichaceae bacterium]|nr:GAF domain-containing protein [Erysipelotrichaceae bacterium]
MNILARQIETFMDIEDKLSFLCNCSALIKESLKDTNWAGFYLYQKGQLHLGPFQGKVACILIDPGKGVCGTSFEKKMLLNIKNVHLFEGHIACDAASNSEIVIPLIYGGRCFGVLDIDSEKYERFTDEDELTLQEVADIIAKKLAQ